MPGLPAIDRPDHACRGPAHDRPRGDVPGDRRRGGGHGV